MWLHSYSAQWTCAHDKRSHRKVLITAASFSLGGLALTLPNARAAKDTNTKLSNADRARDAREHLKKAQEELENVTNNKKNTEAGKALEDVKTAIEHLDKYIEATGNDARGYSNLGFCHELAGRLDDAEAAYKQGIERDPKSVPCRTKRRYPELV